MDTRWMQPEAMKAGQWEIAKGHLSALVSMQGSYSSPRLPGEDMPHTEQRWRDLKKCVEEFIEYIEDHGLAE